MRWSVACGDRDVRFDAERDRCFWALIVCASIVANLVLLFKHADRLEKIVHALSVGSQVRITAAYPPGSLLKDIGKATERFMDETNGEGQSHCRTRIQ